MGALEPQGNGDAAAAGRRGAQHTLSRLEAQEEESFRRLQVALQGGDRFEIDACQTYWLKVAETLRRLDRVPNSLAPLPDRRINGQELRRRLSPT